MKLVHYSSEPLTTLRVIDQGDETFKPRGLWVSDDDCEDNWPAWCEAENFRLEALTHRTEIKLRPDADILFLRSPADIDAFTEQYAIEKIPNFRAKIFIDWAHVASRHHGIVITPYIWKRRLDAMWYYPWDCASGCIWNPNAIASFVERQNP